MISITPKLYEFHTIRIYEAVFSSITIILYYTFVNKALLFHEIHKKSLPVIFNFCELINKIFTERL